jgi:protein phosphatase
MLRVAGRTDVGGKAPPNQDSIFLESVDSQNTRTRGWLGIVADGVGGHAAGDVASAETVRVVSTLFYDPSQTHKTREGLQDAVERANAAVYQKAHDVSEYAGMASTLTAAVLIGERAVIAQVGDSRAYLLRKGSVSQITHDHSFVEELVRSGELTREQARTHRRRNIVTRAIGPNEHVEVDLFELQTHAGDVLLLCSDGLHTMVSDDELGRAAEAEPEAAAAQLVDLANERGGRDNISVVIARIDEVKPRSAMQRLRDALGRLLG